MEPPVGGREEALYVVVTSIRNSLSTGRTLGGRDRCPETGTTRDARSWGSTSLGTEGYEKK